MQVSGLTEIIPFSCTSAIWGQYPLVFLMLTVGSGCSLLAAGSQVSFSFLVALWAQKFTFGEPKLQMTVTSLFTDTTEYSTAHLCGPVGSRVLCCFPDIVGPQEYFWGCPSGWLHHLPYACRPQAAFPGSVPFSTKRKGERKTQEEPSVWINTLWRNPGW